MGALLASLQVHSFPNEALEYSWVLTRRFIYADGSKEAVSTCNSLEFIISHAVCSHTFTFDCTIPKIDRLVSHFALLLVLATWCGETERINSTRSFYRSLFIYSWLWALCSPTHLHAILFNCLQTSFILNQVAMSQRVVLQVLPSGYKYLQSLMAMPRLLIILPDRES